MATRYKSATASDATLDDWTSFIDLLVDELAAASPPTRQVVGSRLLKRLAYIEADPLDPEDHRRQEILTGLTRRLAGAS